MPVIRLLIQTSTLHRFGRLKAVWQSQWWCWLSGSFHDRHQNVRWSNLWVRSSRCWVGGPGSSCWLARKCLKFDFVSSEYEKKLCDSRKGPFFFTPTHSFEGWLVPDYRLKLAPHHADACSVGELCPLLSRSERRCTREVICGWEQFGLSSVPTQQGTEWSWSK